MPLDNPKAQSSEGSVEELFEKLESPLLCYAFRLSGDRAVAEDLVQDAFLKLQQKFAEIREARNWLYRAVHNAALNYVRRRQKLIPFNSEAETDSGTRTDGTDPSPLPDEKIIRWEGIGLVRLSLEGLDERSRELVRLKFYENLSYREISMRTGLTSSNVGYILHHALKAIASELAKNGIVS